MPFATCGTARKMRLNTAKQQPPFGLTPPHWEQGVARVLQEALA